MPAFTDVKRFLATVICRVLQLLHNPLGTSYPEQKHVVKKVDEHAQEAQPSTEPGQEVR